MAVADLDGGAGIQPSQSVIQGEAWRALGSIPAGRLVLSASRCGDIL